MNQQDTLSKSYTDSISSELYRRMEEEELNSNNNSVSSPRYHSQNQSIHSNLNLNNGYTTPKTNNRSILETNDYYNKGRRGSAATDGGSSSYYDPIREEEQDLYSDNDDDDDKITPLPKVQMLVISILLFSEPLTSTILFPFIYFMLKDFHLSDDETEIGRYAGWITSVFFIAQFCTAIMWGKISDRYGRRPVLLTGLIGNSISSCLFGLSKSLWWAVASRAFCGILNGNSGVARSMVSEITDNTNKAKAFSLFGFCWGAGIIGPALGGYLSNPVENFPNIFGNSQFLKEYPYFLPCFVSSIGSLIGFTIGFFYLKESNPNVLASRKLNDEANERTALLRNDNKVNHEEELTKRVIPKSGSIRNITKTSIVVIIAYSVFAFHTMVFDEILPLYFTAPTYAGGLGISRTDFAKTLSLLGVSQLIFQFVVYPRLNVRFSTLVLCRIAFFMFVPLYFIFPELSVFKQWNTVDFMNNSGGSSESWIFRLEYVSLLLFRYCGNCLAYTGLGIMVSTSAAPDILGTVNGICQSSLSLVRALAPTIGGTLWSYSLKDGNQFPFDLHFVYYLIAAMTLFSFIQSFAIPNSVALGGSRNKRR